jgi:integrase
MKRRHAQRLAREMETSRSPLEVAILLAWVYGLRIGDVCRLHSDDCSRIRLHGRRFLVLILRRGKTTKSTGPFTIHIPMDAHHHQVSPLGRWIREIAKENEDRFLFTGHREDTKKTRASMSRKVRTAMKMISPHLEARSIRRGGIQQLANMGLPLAEIQLYYSQHKSVQMLREYLDYGTHDVTQANSHRTRINNFPWMEKESD